jgi:hypothetical protein
MYGLNDKNSPNYIADFAERVRTMAELQLQAQENSMTISELIAYYNEDKINDNFNFRAIGEW